MKMRRGDPTFVHRCDTRGMMGVSDSMRGIRFMVRFHSRRRRREESLTGKNHGVALIMFARKPWQAESAIQRIAR
jgi:hypothetical protein